MGETLSTSGTEHEALRLQGVLRMGMESNACFRVRGGCNLKAIGVNFLGSKELSSKAVLSGEE